MPNAPTSATWSDSLRARLRQLRQDRHLTFVDVAVTTGITKSQLVAIESGTSSNLYLDQVASLAEVYRVDLIALLMNPAAARLPRWRDLPVDVADHVRATLRADRLAANIGTPALAESANMDQSTIVRWESGEYRRIDLIRLYRLAQAMTVPLSRWLSPSSS